MLDQVKVDKLSVLLKRLNEGESSQELKKEAKDFLASVNPADLSAAEQKLIEAGLKPEDLRHLCSAHMEMLGDSLSQFKATLAPGHVVRTMINEHEVILASLDELEKINSEIQSQDNLDQDSLEKLKNLADKIIGAEPHHKREEDVLFVALENKGVFGPPRIMRMEHVEFRKHKKEVKNLADTAEQIGFTEFKNNLSKEIKMLIMILRDHIFKENNILYPTSLQVITDENEWAEMKKECDKIGYCAFTPAE